jgi:4-hydroxy-3-polyprenylbenzoate decarboxylase
VALLHHLRRLNIETHLILSTWAVATLKYELNAPDDRSSYFASLADYNYSPKDVSASLSSGSFRTDGMIIVPCSMKTLASIRIGYDTDLITRAASVTLKERRRLVLVARETPLSSIHLENLLKVSEAGAVVMPPVMAFYTRPQSINDMVQQSVKRMLDLLGVGEEFDEEEERERRDVWTGFDWETRKQEERVAAPVELRRNEEDEKASGSTR